MIGFLVLDYCRREEGSLGLLYAAEDLKEEMIELWSVVDHSKRWHLPN